MSLRREMWNATLALEDQLAAMKAELMGSRNPQHNPLREIHNTMQVHLDNLQKSLRKYVLSTTLSQNTLLIPPSLDQHIQEVANTAAKQAADRALADVRNERQQNIRVAMNVQLGNRETEIEYNNHCNSRSDEYQHRHQHRQRTIVPSPCQSKMQSQLQDAADYIRRRETSVRGQGRGR